MEKISLQINVIGDAKVTIKEIHQNLNNVKTAVGVTENQFTQSFTKVQNVLQNTSDSVKEVSNALKIQLWQSIKEAIDGLAGPFQQSAEQFYQFEHALKEVQGVTGVTTEQLHIMKENAKQLSSEFGSNATDNLKTFQYILSELTPELAKTPDLLNEMSKYGILLGKTMGGDTVGAIQALNTAMNQYGIDLKNPQQATIEMKDMMDIMAIASQQGSVEVKEVAGGLKVVGAIAKDAGLNFKELNASLQVLGKMGLKGAEGGTALRNVLEIMSKDRFIPKEIAQDLQLLGVDISKLADTTLPFKERLKELQKVTNDPALFTGLFGANALAAKGLVNNINLLEEYMAAYENSSGVAQSWAQTVMSSHQETKNRILANLQNIQLSLFETFGSLTVYADLGLSAFQSILTLAPGFLALQQIFKTLVSTIKLQSLWTGILTAKQWLLNIAMNANPIGIIITAVAALITLITYLTGTFDTFIKILSYVALPLAAILQILKNLYNYWQSIKQAFTEEGMIAGIKKIGLVILEALLVPVQNLLELLSKIPGIGNLAQGGSDWVKEFRKNLLANPEKNTNGLTDEQLAEGLAQSKSQSKKMLPTAKQLVHSQTTKASSLTDNKISGAKADVKHIEVKIDSLVKEMNISSANLPDLSSKIKELVSEALISAIRDVEVIG